MPQPSTRRNAQRRRHRQERSDDSFPCKDLFDAVLDKNLNPSEILHQVRRNLSLISASDIHYDPACSLSEEEFDELSVPIAVESRTRYIPGPITYYI
ncbi:hypothetical protein ARMGADRAFT_81618 [Armillaria gallica]|uniref:Uncharacterized protein n=1 Tax=Armillaria gallica TaxID=47427 RepID=A0A2H3CAU5_ARMGA|nr:hypothetical protein ARMGADRAFT_81618 [Armillaria gallica]